MNNLGAVCDWTTITTPTEVTAEVTPSASASDTLPPKAEPSSLRPTAPTFTARHIAVLGRTIRKAEASPDDAASSLLRHAQLIDGGILISQPLVVPLPTKTYEELGKLRLRLQSLKTLESTASELVQIRTSRIF
jgi:hypothetical protein